MRATPGQGEAGIRLVSPPPPKKGLSAHHSKLKARPPGAYCYCWLIRPTRHRHPPRVLTRHRSTFAGRAGPCHGMEAAMLPTMVHFTIRTHFPHIWATAGPGATEAGGALVPPEVYYEFYREVSRGRRC